MKARAAVKDVARVLRIPPGEADKITKLIPSGPAYSLTIPEAAEKVGELKDLLRTDPAYGRLVQLSSRIEGISRHMSVHAAGVVIAPGPLAEYVPVCTAPTRGAGQSAAGEDAIITQYDMVALEKVGMLKMDMLGLKTLTVIHDAVEMIAARTGERIDVDALPFDDPDGVCPAPARPHRRHLPVRIGAGHGHAPRHEVRPVRRPRGLQRAAPARPARRRHAHRVHQAEARPGAGHLRASAARRTSSSPRTASSPTRSR